jgi:hypothetical protein
LPHRVLSAARGGAEDVVNSEGAGSVAIVPKPFFHRHKAGGDEVKTTLSNEALEATMNPFGLLIVAAGLFGMAGGVFDWDWFMNHRKARFMCAILSRNGARIFYVLLGLGLVVLGTLLTTGVIQDAG